jgi:hypothetical protein
VELVDAACLQSAKVEERLKGKVATQKFLALEKELSTVE